MQVGAVVRSETEQRKQYVWCGKLDASAMRSENTSRRDRNQAWVNREAWLAKDGSVLLSEFLDS